MSGDDDAGARRSARRVTLKWERPPLALPGEGEPGARTEPDSVAELALPSIDEAPEPVVATPPDAPGAESLDAWERQRPRFLTPPPFRTPASPPAVPVPDVGDALELVDRHARPLPASDLAVEMSDRYALGDYTAALRAAELVLGRDPDDPLAREIAAGSKKHLEQLYRSRLGPLAQVPRAIVEGSAVRWLGLDARAGFVLSRVDGRHTLAEILDIGGMPVVEVLKTLVELLEVGAIELTPRRS